jgi:Na+-transporting NADH:ubiquinone oxidoreductase subunit NqrB
MDRPDDWDPRWYQILCLSCLLVYGMVYLEFDLTVPRVLLTIGAAQATQYACTRYFRLPRFDPLSAMISALSLTLMLRTNYHSVAVLAAVAAIGSKFLIRVDGKHVFNPTNFACAIAMLTGVGWLSPGQWGSQAWLAFFFACMGSFVVHRSKRRDITIAAMVTWTAVLFGRSWLLGEPLTIPWHRTENGAFLLFAFFMISDPKTTPDTRLGRIVFATAVAAGSWWWTFRMFNNNGLIWSLFALSPLVPLVDRLWKGSRFQWPAATVTPSVENTHATLA